jgi:hypothetical protein
MPRFRLPDGAVFEFDDGAKGVVSKSASTSANAGKGTAPRTPAGLPSQAELVRRVKDELAKSGITDAVLAKEAARKRADDIGALKKQAADWRQRALDGRVTGLDSGIREHLLLKAADAEKAAQRLRGGDEDNPTARNHEAAAEEYRQRARDAVTAEARRYLYDKAREFDARASLAREQPGRR